MVVVVLFPSRHALPRLLRLLMGDSLLGRLRSGAVAILGLAMAVGLGLIGLALELGAPAVLGGGPLPELPVRGGSAATVQVQREDAIRAGGTDGSRPEPSLPDSSPAVRPEPGDSAGSKPGGSGQAVAAAPLAPEAGAETGQPAPAGVPVATAPVAPSKPPASAPAPVQDSGRADSAPVSSAAAPGHGRGGRPASADPPPGRAKASAPALPSTDAAKPPKPLKAPKEPKAPKKPNGLKRPKAPESSPAAPEAIPVEPSTPPGHGGPPGNAHGHQK